MSVHGCMSYPCPVCVGGVTGVSSVSSTFRQTEHFTSWVDAIRFVDTLQGLKSKPRVWRAGNAWFVRWEPIMLTFNYTSAA